MRREHQARKGWWFFLGLLVGLAGASVTWGAELVLYDNFNDTTRINPDNWFGSETKRPGSILEAHRFVANGSLHLSVGSYGGQGSNTGRRTGSIGLGVKTPRSITALQAQLTVLYADTEGCPENEHPTQARAQMVGFFFNANGKNVQGDLTGEIVAVIEKVSDSKADNFIRAVLLQCTSKGCSKGKPIKSLLFKHKWKLNEPDVLRIEWEPSAFQFVYTVNPEGDGAETLRIGYDKAIGPSEPPKKQLQRIRVRQHTANCKSGRRGALTTVSVDDVHLGFLDTKTIAALGSGSEKKQ